jgi:acetyl-CoA carboxylase carboxyltransferase component
MDTYHYTFSLTKKLKKGPVSKVGVAGSGNLEVVIKPNPASKATQITVNTVITGTAKMGGTTIAITSQQKDFIGGAVGEVHGAKIIGLIQYAMKHRLAAIVLLIDSGGVRLQEANVGEIEISEIIRALLAARSAGIKIIGVVCGVNGCKNITRNGISKIFLT